MANNVIILMLWNLTNDIWLLKINIYYNFFFFSHAYLSAGPEHGHERAVRVPGYGAEDEGDLG